MVTNRKIVLAKRPSGYPAAEHFRLEEETLRDELKDGEVLLRTTFLSLDPYMRIRMGFARDGGKVDDTASYARVLDEGETILGGTMAVVEKSASEHYAVGDVVRAGLGWQERGIVDTAASRTAAIKVKVPEGHPASVGLGAVGMPGVTAWIGLLRIGSFTKGETVFVSAASGAVGQVVGQLARLLGASRVVGIAGSDEKCAYVVNELGFDACLNRRTVDDLPAALAAQFPDGIDVYFDNTAGPILDAVLPNMRRNGRVVCCGLISQYNTAPYGITNFASVLAKRLRIHGFIVSDEENLPHWPAALRQLNEFVASGALRYKEDVHTGGLDRAVDAFLTLFDGTKTNFGKVVVAF